MTPATKSRILLTRILGVLLLLLWLEFAVSLIVGTTLSGFGGTYLLEWGREMYGVSHWVIVLLAVACLGGGAYLCTRRVSPRGSTPQE